MNRKQLAQELAALTEWRFDAGMDLAEGGLTPTEKRETAARIRDYTARIRELEARLGRPRNPASRSPRRTIRITTRRALTP